ncbi:hypothetical protein HG530_001240 [Fusarium avenaceum]|nr:hypothetical protein HG530_001240 [Fusarium avenaceum]
MPERRQSHPKAPTGLDDETAIETHDLIHRAEEEEQKMHGKDALTQEDDGPQEGNQQGQSAMDKVKDIREADVTHKQNTGTQKGLHPKHETRREQNHKRQSLPTGLRKTCRPILIRRLPVRRADLLPARITNVIHGLALELIRHAHCMRARCLVRGGVVQIARLVVAQRTDRIEDVVENVVVADPGAVFAIEAARQEVHAVGRAEGQFVVLGVDQVRALGGVDVFECHLDRAASRGLVGG